MDAPRRTVDAARRLRRALTPPEVLLWSALRLRPHGLKFRRQHPFGPFVLDFYCDATRLVVEVDGRAHDSPERVLRDADRDAFLRRSGLMVLRIPAVQVLEDLASVVDQIVGTAIAEAPSTMLRMVPRPQRGRI